jgi:hypothetical protein
LFCARADPAAFSQVQPLKFVFGSNDVDIGIQTSNPFIPTGLIENIPFYDSFAFYHAQILVNFSKSQVMRNADFSLRLLFEPKRT